MSGNKSLAIAACMFVLVACNGESKPNAGGSGPSHGGAMLKVADGAAHVEVVQDEKAATFTIYVRGADGKTPLAVAKAPKLTIRRSDGPREFASVPQDSKDGRASVFQVADKLMKRHGLEGSVTLEIDGKSHTASFQHRH